jgi:hypothetical protein
MIRKITDTMVEMEGENLRQVTWVPGPAPSGPEVTRAVGLRRPVPGRPRRAGRR